jgi:hypothetical protein
LKTDACPSVSVSSSACRHFGAAAKHLVRFPVRSVRLFLYPHLVGACARMAGMGTRDYFKNYELKPEEASPKKQKFAETGDDLLDKLRAPSKANYIYSVPRAGGLICLILIGEVFSRIRDTLEAAVEGLKPGENGRMSETAKALGLRYGFGSQSNGYIHTIEGTGHTIVAMVLNTFWWKARDTGVDLKFISAVEADTNIANEVGIPVTQKTRREVFALLAGKSVPRAMGRMVIALALINPTTGSSTTDGEADPAPARCRVMYTANQYRFKESIEEKGFANEKVGTTWGSIKVFPTPADALATILELNEQNGYPSTVLKFSEEDTAIAEEWAAKANDEMATNVSEADPGYLSMKELGLQ